MNKAKNIFKVAVTVLFSAVGAFLGFALTKPIGEEIANMIVRDNSDDNNF